MQLQFVPAYFDGNWFFMTGSYKGSLGMNSSTEAYIWLDYWTLYKESLEVMMSEKLIRGFHVVEELAVNNILEVSVLPHVHAVIDADEVDAEMVLEAVESVKTSSGDKYALMLASDVVVDPITSQESLMDRLRYIYKPINLVTAYERDWREHCGSDADQARKLNNHATDLVLGYSHINYRHAKMHSKGTLDSKSKNHIGIPASNRPQYKPQLRKLQAEHALNYIESDVALN